MTELVLVRHGQANSHATDEESYDRLSDLGHVQAGWLGAHMQQTNPHFDRVVTGTLSRQAETARAMGYEITQQDARLNELSYFDLAKALEDQHGILAPQGPTEFATHLPEVIDHWQQDRLGGVSETFGDFAGRVTGVIDEFATTPGRTLLVTSGGVIGMVLRYVLALDNAGMSRVMLQTLNSSLHCVRFTHGQLMLATFNATPHLDAPDRIHARTYV